MLKVNRMIKAGKILSIVIATSLFGCSQQSVETEVEKVTVDRSTSPNVVIFYIDDLGWGDLGSYGATGVETPEIDRIANNGIRFTDGHSSAATCTPSRYSLLTGEHGFRSKAKILKVTRQHLFNRAKARWHLC